MEEFLALMEKDPFQMGTLIATRETWQEPLAASVTMLQPDTTDQLSRMARKLTRLRTNLNRLRSGSPVASLTVSDAPSALKLYQPAHQRYYLVTASLVCNVTGFPNRTINRGNGEQATFVVRRLVFEDGQQAAVTGTSAATEYAYVRTDGGYSWTLVSESADGGNTLQSGEEQLPMFAVTGSDDEGRPRRILAGLIPVARKEAYLAAPRASGSNCTSEEVFSQSGMTGKTALKIHFRMKVTEPWKRLIDRAFDVRSMIVNADETPTPGQQAKLVKEAREQIQTGSWLILADLSSFLEKYHPPVFAVVTDATKTEADLPSDAERKLFRALEQTRVSDELAYDLVSSSSGGYRFGSVATSLRDALRLLRDPTANWIDRLDSLVAAYDRNAPGQDWPTFLFPLADPMFGGPTIPEYLVGTESEEESGQEITPAQPGNPLDPVVGGKTREMAQANVDKLAVLLVRALPDAPPARVPHVPLAAQSAMNTQDGWFSIRCVFTSPLCGPLVQPSVSDKSRVFQMAGYFDPDAPARPIRIALPIDTSPAGLRKFDKNTAFMISDVLCGQIKRVKGLTLGDLVRSVLPWPFHKDLSVPEQGPCATSQGTSAGMICTMSLPIITLCALLMLMIIVNLLDIIFRWVPFFMMCFPLPGFKAKK
jgi:hypothetical protein